MASFFYLKLLGDTHILDENENLVYVVSLLVALGLSFILPRCTKGPQRLIFSSIIGSLNIILFCRSQIMYLVLGFIGIYIALILQSKLYVHYIISFFILTIARFSPLFSLNFYSLTNSVLLLYTLRLIDIARYISPVTVEDTSNENRIKFAQSKDESQMVASYSEVGMIVLAYVTFFPGLWAGPLLPPENVMSCLLTDKNEYRGSILLDHASETESTMSSKSSSPKGLVFYKHKNVAINSLKSRRADDNNETMLINPSSESIKTSSSAMQLNHFYINNFIDISNTTQEVLDFFIIRLYQSLFHVAAFILIQLLFWYIYKKFQLDCSHFDTIILNLGNSTRSWSIIFPLQFIILFLYLLLFRSRFIVAWLISEITMVCSGIRTNEQIDIYSTLNIIRDKKIKNVSNNVPYQATLQSVRNNSTLQSCLDTFSNVNGCPKILKYVLHNSSNYSYILEQTQIVHNYCSKDIETGLSLQMVLRGWNRSVQSWFVRNVYKQYVPKSKLLRQFAVVSLSAYWHGIRPGYYFAFLVLPLFQFYQLLFQNSINIFHSSTTISIVTPNEKFSQHILHRISQFKNMFYSLLTIFLISFIVIPFVCKDALVAIHLWRSLRFYGFALCFLMAITGKLMIVWTSSANRFLRSSPTQHPSIKSLSR